jgi:hypothetical protein
MPTKTSQTNSRGASIVLNGAHREIKQLANQVAIYWRYGRGAGSVPLASFKASTLAEALELEANGALELAEAWTAIHRPMPSIAYLSGMLAGFQASKKFARMAASTQAEWSRCISQINADIGTMTRRRHQNRHQGFLGALALFTVSIIEISAAFLALHFARSPSC